ncbi:Pycsar system effector family protein [Nocardioides sp. NPDC000445]|uniref:Pycsar system effector family protein n=1 Tax=Nocardioides sp. NPDC000445 TaxID=3154257 RepID=UPI0033172A59
MSRWLYARCKCSHGAIEQPDATAATPDADHAWRALALVNEWIRHSDAKAGVTLAFAGVLGTMTFNLAKGSEARSLAFDVLVVVASALLLLTGGLCGWTLTPRVNDKDAARDAINRLFFASISRNFKGRRQEFADVLHTLTADPVELTRDLADQIHANARIATVKAEYAKWAIRTVLAAGATVAALAIVTGTANL